MKSGVQKISAMTPRARDHLYRQRRSGYDQRVDDDGRRKDDLLAQSTVRHLGSIACCKALCMAYDSKGNLLATTRQGANQQMSV